MGQATSLCPFFLNYAAGVAHTYNYKEFCSRSSYVPDAGMLGLGLGLALRTGNSGLGLGTVGLGLGSLGLSLGT